MGPCMATAPLMLFMQEVQLSRLNESRSCVCVQGSSPRFSLGCPAPRSWSLQLATSSSSWTVTPCCVCFSSQPNHSSHVQLMWLMSHASMLHTKYNDVFVLCMSHRCAPHHAWKRAQQTVTSLAQLAGNPHDCSLHQASSLAC